MRTNTIIKIAGLGVAIVTALYLSFYGAVYFLSESKLRSAELDPASFAFQPSEDPNVIAHGRHVTRTRGCFGCHGQQLEGKDFGEQWDWPKRAVAPNLAQYARDHSAETMEAAIRQGIGHDGKALISMPSFNFVHLTDEDLSALISFLRSAPIVTIDLPKPELGFPARWDLLTGAETHYAEWADQVPPLKFASDENPLLATGEYLAMTMCNECHGLDVRGNTMYPPPTPDLAIVAALERETFVQIITTGKGLDGRSLGIMELVAPDRFPHLTEEEIDALYTYLSSLYEQPVPENVFWRPAQ